MLARSSLARPIPQGAVERVAERFAQPALADRDEPVATAEIGVDHQRVPLDPRSLAEDLIDAFGRHRGAVRPRGVHRVEAIGDRQDARQQRDRIALEPFRVPAAVVAFMVVEHTGQQVGDRVEAGQDAVADDRVLLDVFELVIRERPALGEDVIADADLADVVQQAGQVDVVLLGLAQAELAPSSTATRATRSLWP